MGFLAPGWILAGLITVGLPIYIHLLRQHKTTPLPFSSLMFFERRTQSSIKHRRLKYLLLMALRIALVALLALAFAQPSCRRAPSMAGGAKRILVVVDDSFSMRAGSRLADAKRQAAGLIASRSGAATAQVAALGGQFRLLTEAVQDPQQLRAAVESIRPGDGRGSYGELTRALRLLMQASREPIQVHFFTDVQRSAMPLGFSDLALPDGVQLILHPVAAKPEPNWSVDTVSAPSMLWDPKKARVQATVAGTNTPAAKRTVSLVAGGKTLGSKTVDIAAGGRATVEFQGLDVPYGFSRCEVKIDSADALAADDHAQFAVQRSDPRKILFVHEARDTRSPFYFRTALAAAAEAAFSLDTAVTEQTGNLDPARFALVVLSDVLSAPAAFQEALQNYVRGGGAVWVAAGPAAARHQRIPVLDQPVTEGKYFSRAGERFAMVGEADPTHPSLRRAAKWEGVKFYYAVKIDPGQARVVARLSDQTPVLVEKKIGEGRVLLFASTFDNISNDFPLLPVFVPFVEQTARYLAGMEDRGSTVLVGSFLELRSAREQAVSVEVIDPDGRRPLSLTESARAPSYQTTREGFYEVRRANGRHEMVAVNADRKESDLTLAAQDTLDLWAGSGAGSQTAAKANGSSPAEGEQRRPWSLWWYVMMGVLGAAVAESLLASRYLGVPRDEGPEGSEPEGSAALVSEEVR